MTRASLRLAISLAALGLGCMRPTGGIGVIVNNGTAAFDNVVVTE